MQIHPFALVSPDAEIGEDVTIGPFSVIEGGVKIGEGCTIAARVSVKEGTFLGPQNEVCEGAVLGGRPQHLRAGTAFGKLHIGRGNKIRENVTIHRGLTPDDSTTIGDENLIMVNVHVAHDCHLGSNTILANNVMLAGHVSVGDRAYLSGAVGVHQFCRIGKCAMVGGQAHINQDVPPFVTVDGETSTIVGLNIIGLRRAGYTEAQIVQLKLAYRMIFREGLTWAETLVRLGEAFSDGPAAEFAPFLSTGKRGFIRERRAPRAASVSFGTTNVSDETSGSAHLRRAG